MITLYTWTTPNGRKPIILLEELNIPYRIEAVNIQQGEQFKPEFLAISPNNKIPAIVDEDAEGGSLPLFESAAILIYLAEKHQQFLAPSGPARYKALEWLSWQIGGLGPMLGQLGFFERAEEKSEQALKRFREEGGRLLTVMEKQLAASPYLAGEDYTIADIAAYPWVRAAEERLKGALGAQLEASPALQRWLTLVGERPAVQRGMALPKV